MNNAGNMALRDELLANFNLVLSYEFKVPQNAIYYLLNYVRLTFTSKK
jgi:hypothetical protein